MTSAVPQPPSSLQADRASRDAAIVLGLTLPGDIVLYLLLPLYASEFGVTLVEAGFLLAANRLVRIVGYGWVVRFYERNGAGPACLWAAGATVLATLSYAFFSGVALLLVSRLAWGLAFGAMNISTQVLATAEASGAARRSGSSRAISSVGPMLALILAAVLVQFIGPRPLFIALSLVALLAIPIARRLPRGGGVQILPKKQKITRPSGLDTWGFIQGLTLDGLFVIGMTVLAAKTMGDYAALGAGAAFALRYAGEIVLGRAGGSAATRWGATRLLVLLSLGSAVAMAAIGFGFLWSGALVLVVLRSLLQPLPAPVAAMRHPGADRIPALARLATWRDIGAGVGPLAAGWLLGVLSTPMLYGGAALLLVASVAVLGKDPAPAAAGTS